MMRPLLIVSNNVIKFSPLDLQGNPKFTDLIKKGVIEYLDVEE
jgi:RNA polymerase Rpb2, domain 5